jgi:PAS domain S-box-containing protein
MKEEKRPRTDIAELEKQCRTLLESIPDVVMNFDRSHRHTFVSPNVKELGLKPEAFIGRTHEEMGFPDGLCAFLSASLEKVFVTGLPLQTEFEAELPAGRRLFNWRLSPLKDAAGSTVSVTTTATDITDYNNLRADYRRLFEVMQEGFAQLRPLLRDGRPFDLEFTAANGAFAKMWGLQQDSTDGKKVSELLPVALPLLLELQAGAQAGAPAGTVHETKDGRHLEARAFIPREGLVALICTDRTREILEKREADRRLSLLEMAGSAAGFGVWSFKGGDKKVYWSDQVAAIHEVPKGFSPGLEEAIGFYAPEHRSKITSAVGRCLDKSEPFNEELEIITAAGNRRWVRATGAAQADPGGGPKLIYGSFHDITPQKQQEQRARAHAALLEAAGAAADFGFWEVDTRSYAVAWSAQTALIHELPGRRSVSVEESLMFYAEPWREKIREAFNACAAEGRRFDEEVEIITASGRRRWVRVIGIPERGSDARVSKVFGLLCDISDRKGLEDRLRESTERFRSLFEEAPLAYQSLDAAGHILEVNKAWLDALGYVREEVAGQPFEKFLSPEQLPVFRERFPRFIEAGKVHSELDLLRKGGGILTAAFEGRVARDAEGRFRRTHCIFTDVTETRKSQHNLRDSEEKLRALFEGSNDAIFLHRMPEKGRMALFEEVNSEACRRLGYSREELLGMGPADLDADAMNEHKQAALKTLEETGRALFRMRHRCKDGALVPVEISTNVINFRGGRYAISVARDTRARDKFISDLELTSSTLAGLGGDREENLNRLVQLACSLLGADAGLYNRLRGDRLRVEGRWKLPPDMLLEDKAEGHICHLVITKDPGEGCMLLRDLPSTPFAASDPNVARYALKTYLGCPVRKNGRTVGSLALVWGRDYAPDFEELKLLRIIASVAGAQEELRGD